MNELIGKMMIKKDKSLRFDSARAFFNNDGSVWMRLTRAATLEVIHLAADQGQVVVMVEGGIWQNPGFMSQLDAIWKSVIDPPCDTRVALTSNRDAADFVRACPERVDTFIITAPPITGYRHKQDEPS